MAQFTPEDKARLSQLHTQRKQLMTELMANPNKDELNKKFLLGQLQDVQANISQIVKSVQS